MLKLGPSLDQRNLTNSSANKLCKRLSEIAAHSFPDKMAESRVFLTTGQEEGVEAAYHLALRFWNRSGLLGTKFLGGYKKQKIITFRNCYHGSTFISASMSSASPEYGWTRWMEGYDRDVCESNPHRMFTSIDPPHELFLNKLKMRPLENTGQAAGAYLNLHTDFIPS
jgi:adenosylmethionine-8-amino-7-oxononanoate aminotransferase